MAIRDPYDVLQVERNASPDEIKSAFRKLARKFHPDVNPNDPTAEEKFKEINEAYAILSDPERRQRFDQFGQVEDMPQGDFFQGGAGGFADIFDMFFGAQGNGGGQRSQRRSGRDGEDIRAEVTITLSQVLTGLEKEVRFRRGIKCTECDGTGSEGKQPPKTCDTCRGAGSVTRVQNTFIGQVRTSTTCPTCSGTGTVIDAPCKKCRGRSLEYTEASEIVNIPPGIDNAVTIRHPHKGGEGVGQGIPGDLYVTVFVEDDARFERDGTELLTATNISFAQAALGHELEFDGLTEKIQLKIPAGTQPGTIFKARGQGLPRLRGNQRGDLHVQVNVVIPKKLSEAQAKLLRDYSELAGEDVRSHDENWLEGLFKWKR